MTAQIQGGGQYISGQPASGGGSFNVLADLDPLHYWLGLDDADMVVTAGNVTTWGDKGRAGTPVDWSSVGLNPPSYDSAHISNGKPAVQFDAASSESMDGGLVSSFNFLHQNAAGTFACVYLLDSVGTSQTLFDNCTTTTAQHGFSYTPEHNFSGGDGIYALIARGVVGQPTVLLTDQIIPPTATPQIAIVRKGLATPAASLTAGTNQWEAEVRLNGVSVLQKRYSNVPSAVNASQQATIGAGSLSGGQFFDGPIFEMLIDDRRLPDYAIIDYERWAADEYGIPLG